MAAADVHLAPPIMKGLDGLADRPTEQPKAGAGPGLRMEPSPPACKPVRRLLDSPAGLAARPCAASPGLSPGICTRPLPV